ncbi:MAG: hypothetical protein ABUS79_08120 [Pseudomonadota bacterium]
MTTATASADDLRERVRAWGDMLKRETRQRPARSAAIALGAGYLLGGGLFSPLTARLVAVGLRVGLRMALIPFVTHTLTSLGQRFINGGGEGRFSNSDDDEANDGSRRNQKRNHDQEETHS